MVYYPLSAAAGRHPRNLLIISTPADLQASGFCWRLLRRLGLRRTLRVCRAAFARRVGAGFLIGEKFIRQNDSVICLVLGDNIFHGVSYGYAPGGRAQCGGKGCATIFRLPVEDLARRYGVAEFDAQGHCLLDREKPAQPKSNYAS